MQKILLIACILGLSLPVAAQTDNLGNSLAAGYLANSLLAGPSDWPSFHLPKKKPKVKELPNGNIVYNGREYAPVINATPISTIPNNSPFKPF